MQSRLSPSSRFLVRGIPSSGMDGILGFLIHEWLRPCQIIIAFKLYIIPRVIGIYIEADAKQYNDS